MIGLRRKWDILAELGLGSGGSGHFKLDKESKLGRLGLDWVINSNSELGSAWAQHVLENMSLAQFRLGRNFDF